MIAKKRDSKSAMQPALVLLYGTATAPRTNYPLNNDAMIIGKSSSCDLVVNAPDISHVHCVITRTAGGFSVRDCQSRSGTRLNGDRVKEGLLHHEDILQIGPFSFQVVLPPSRNPEAGVTGEPPLARSERKRKNLARLALEQRRRLHQLLRQERPANVPSNGEPPNLSRQAETLRQKLREAEQKLRQLEHDTRELTRDRELLSHETAEFQRCVQEKEQELEHLRITAEKELAQRQADLDKEIEQRRQNIEQEFTQRQADFDKELEQKRQQLEQELDQQRRQLQEELARQKEEAEQQIAQLAAEATATAEPELTEEELEKTTILPLPQEQEMEKTIVLPADPEQDDAQKLHLRQHELDLYAKHLAELRQQLHQQQQQLEISRQQLKQRFLEMQTEHQQNLLTREQWAAEQTETLETLERKQQAIAQAEEALVQQREMVMGMMNDLKLLQEQLRHRHDEEVEALRREIEQLRQGGGNADKLRRENQELHQIIEEEEKVRRELMSEATAFQDKARKKVQYLKEENDKLRHLIAEKDALLEHAQQQPAAIPAPMDIPAIDDVDSYEAELVQYRRELEADRAKLNAEIQLIRQKNDELEEATREAEMELSRDRAEIARERIRLERLRQEIQAEMERLQKDNGMSERLAPVRRLREEMVERQR